MKFDIFEIQDRLDRVDLDMLYNIYLFRCLTLNQIYNTFYKSQIKSFNAFLDKKVKTLLEVKIVEEVVFNNDNIALFLTKQGIDLIKEIFDLPTNIITDNVIKNGYHRAFELKMLPRLIPHQIYLNQFVLDFKAIFEYKQLQISWKYFDEKYVSQYTSIRPDGLIRMGDIDLFLEMDMNTESKVQLLQKWRHYRAFLKSTEYRENKRKIIVLFIIDNVSNIENRKNLVKKTIAEGLIDSVSGDFEIMIGTKDNLLKKVFYTIIPEMFQKNTKKIKLKEVLRKKHSFHVSDAAFLKELFHDVDYGFYIRKNDDHGNIIVENSVIQEYLLEFYDKDTLSLFHKILYLSRNSMDFKLKYRRDIRYIIVYDDLDILYKDLKLFDQYMTDNIYYTTLQRLNDYPFYKAICQFDSMGRRFSFKDNSLTMRTYETTK